MSFARHVVFAAVAALLAVLLCAAPSVAHLPSKGGATSGTPATGSHTENPRRGIEEVGFHPLLNKGFNTDVWGQVTRDNRLFAYSGTWGALTQACPSEGDNASNPQRSGVKVVDVTDASAPRLAAKIGTVEGAQNNDVKVERIAVPDGFSGDILAHSLEPCGAEGLASLALGDLAADVPLAQTGFQLYDVSEPTQPKRLGTYNNGGFGTHNLFMVPRPDLGRAFVAAVYNDIGVLSGVRGELQIVEITDPNDPQRVSSFDLDDANLPCEERGDDSAMCYLHDVWTSPDGKTAYLSYWDAGLVLLDISDPENPRLIGRAQEQVEGAADPEGWLNEEGNTHAAVPMQVGDRKLVIVGDEDFTGPGPKPFVRVDQGPGGDGNVATGEKVRGAEFSGTKPIADSSLSGVPALESDDPGGCAYLSAQSQNTDPWIAVTRRGGNCPLFQQKVTAAEQAGADGLIVVNNSDAIEQGSASGGIPAIMIPKSDGDRLLASIENTDPDQVRLTLELLAVEGEDNPWGFMRVVDVTSDKPSDWRQVSTFRAPHVEGLPQPAESSFTAHNPIIGSDNRIYYAWYTDGVRVLEPASTPGQFTEVAWFVPRPDDHPDDLDKDPYGVQEDHVGFWGSYPVCHPRTGERLILNSDLNRGLYVLRMQETPCFAPPAPPREQGNAPDTGGAQTPRQTPQQRPEGARGSATSGSPAPTACAASTTLRAADVRRRGRRLQLGFATRGSAPVTVDVFQQSIGRRVIGERLVARFEDRTGAVRWNGRANRRGRKVTDGYYFVRFRTGSAERRETRRIALRRVRGRWSERPAFSRSTSCGLLRKLKLERPVFGGRTNRELGIAYRVARSARVTVTVLRGSRVVKRYAARTARGGHTGRLRFDSEGRPRGDYRVRVEARRGNRREVATLVSRRV